MSLGFSSTLWRFDIREIFKSECTFDPYSLYLVIQNINFNELIVLCNFNVFLLSEQLSMHLFN